MGRHMLAVSVMMVVVLGCKGEKSAKDRWLEKICACQSEECIAETAGAMAADVRAKGITAQEAADVSKRTFECVAKMRARNASGPPPAQAGMQPSTPAPAPAPAPVAPSGAQDADEAKRTLDADVARLSSLATPAEIAAAYATEADATCACSGPMCAGGGMARLKALNEAFEKQGRTNMSSHDAAIRTSMERWTGCVQTAFNSQMERESTVTKAGEAVLELYKRYADEACACKDTACIDAATARVKQAQANLAKLETAADGMNEGLMAHATRAAECHAKLLQGK